MSENQNFYIVTDSNCDLPESVTASYHDFSMPKLTYILDGETDPELDSKTFYDRLRNGSTCKTSQVTPGQFSEAFRKGAEAGLDVLYIAFSSALSGTIGSGITAAKMAAEEFPGRRFLVVDTKGASCGEAWMVDKAIQMREEGKGIDEVYRWLEENKQHCVTWFTVQDLHYLHRGGRVSASAAILGSTLKINPILHVDSEGRLIPVDKVIGRKHALRALVKKMKDHAIEPEHQRVFICQADCMDDAERLTEMLKKEWPDLDVRIITIGPVVGAHSGPGSMGLAFFGDER